ncbi:hypothetical protein E2C01_056633 [Portunus trituberculatus]|uniref:Uncharacterized protein n=1 Tax=Portunus trituberculatus TaxID=210409 RepID=A0A5B7GZQ2_PORTR|nr:hypothetical protein [Portunus trituberculatus]
MEVEELRSIDRGRDECNVSGGSVRGGWVWLSLAEVNEGVWPESEPRTSSQPTPRPGYTLAAPSPSLTRTREYSIRTELRS